MISPIGRRMLFSRGFTPLEIKLRRQKFLTGYTLIELILLAIIIVTLVGISAPQFRNTFSDLQLKDASFNLSSLISFTQERAIVEGVPFKLVLDADKARYYLEKADPKNPAKYVMLEEKTGRVFTLPRDIKLKTDKKEVIFYPDGHSDKAVIYFVGKNKSLKISLKGNLGYVKIENNI